MINWIRTKLHNFIFPSVPDEAVGATIRAERDEIGYEADSALRFQVTSARGGIILSMRKYDDTKDRTYYQNYVIPDGEDVATSMAHIIAMEMLRNSS